MTLKSINAIQEMPKFDLQKNPYLNEGKTFEILYFKKIVFGIAETFSPHGPWPMILSGTTKGFLHQVVKSSQPLVLA